MHQALTVLMIAMYLTVVGCSTVPTSQKIPQPEDAITKPDKTYDYSKTIAYSIQNRPIVCHVFGQTNGLAGKGTILILATIHGDESAGTPLLKELVHKMGQGISTFCPSTVWELWVNQTNHTAQEQENENDHDHDG